MHSAVILGPEINQTNMYNATGEEVIPYIFLAINYAIKLPGEIKDLISLFTCEISRKKKISMLIDVRVLQYGE